jgi:hypothetical protein
VTVQCSGCFRGGFGGGTTGVCRGHEPLGIRAERGEEKGGGCLVRRLAIALAASGRGDRRPRRAVGREHAVIAGEIHARHGYQGHATAAGRERFVGECRRRRRAA